MRSISIYETAHNGTRKHHRIPKRYLPKSLTVRDKRTQLKNLKKSRSLYKKGIYHARPPIKSFTQKKSKHVRNASRLYGVDVIAATPELAEKTGCSVAGLRKIINKGEGAFYSSGSRPNQTAFSWGIARLASAITGGPSSRIDYHILEKECRPDSLALQKAIKPKSHQA